MRNHYLISGDKIFITLQDLTQTEVNKHHHAKLSGLDATWYKKRYGNEVYVVANVKKADGRRTHLMLHRFISECCDNEYVLHRDNNTMNNTDDNLVTTTRNRGCAKRKRDLDTGVGLDEKRLMWYAVMPDGLGYKTIGYFLSQQQAQEWYDNQMNV